jgi:hypothetical protein
MPWEKRGRNRYYVRHRHIAGKMQRTYFGRGPEAELAAALDEQKQVDRQARWEAQRVESARLQDLIDAVHALSTFAETMSLAALITAGYRQHDRGQWRRRRSHG